MIKTVHWSYNRKSINWAGQKTQKVSHTESWSRTEVYLQITGERLIETFDHLYGEKNVTLELYLITYKEANSSKLKIYMGNVEIEENIF